MLAVVLDGVRRSVAGCWIMAMSPQLFCAGESWVFEAIDPLAPPVGADPAPGRLTAPMPGHGDEVLVVGRGRRSARASR